MEGGEAPGREAGPGVLERADQEAIEGGGEEEIEVANGGELGEAGWQREVGVPFHQFAQFLVDGFARAASDEVGAGGAVAGRLVRHGKPAALRELGREPVGDGELPAIRRDGDQSRPDDRQDLGIVNSPPEAAPGDGIHLGRGRRHGISGRRVNHAGTVARLWAEAGAEQGLEPRCVVSGTGRSAVSCTRSGVRASAGFPHHGALPPGRLPETEP